MHLKAPSKHLNFSIPMNPCRRGCVVNIRKTFAAWGRECDVRVSLSDLEQMTRFAVDAAKPQNLLQMLLTEGCGKLLEEGGVNRL